MLKHISLMVVSISLLAGPAVSADMSGNTDFDWTGLYLGADAGYQFGNGHLADSFCNGDPTRCGGGTWISHADLSDIVGGGHIGFNQQLQGGLVLGAEINVGFGGNAEGSFYANDNLGTPDKDDFAKGEIDLGLTGAARVHAGFAVDRFMPFVSGGLAFASYDATITNPTDTNLPRSGKGSLLGWTIGAGAKYAVTDNFLIGAEYTYTDYGSDDLGLKNSAIDSDAWAHKADLHSHDVRFSASFKF